jgi:hypothetical protein
MDFDMGMVFKNMLKIMSMTELVMMENGMTIKDQEKEV